MIRCQEQHRAELVAYLSRKIHFNIFLLSDIQLYGFSHPNQQVFLLTNPDGGIRGVCLRYYGNLLLSGETPDRTALHDWVTSGVRTIMGEASLVRRAGEYLGDLGVYQEKRLLALPRSWTGQEEALPVRVATERDVDRLHAFLMTVPGFQALYGEKDMISNRIASGEGVHLYCEDDGKIIAHINSAAQTAGACMLGGLAVAPEYQARGLGTALTSTLCRRMAREGRQLHVFSDCAGEHSLFEALGFREIGKWGVFSVSE